MMKTFKLLIFNILLFTQITSAQNTGIQSATPEQRAEVQTSMMKTKLKLDSDQVSKVKAINLKYALKFEPLITSTASKLSRLKESKSIMTAKDAELKKIFTASQYQQYDDLKAEMRAKFKEKYAGAN